MKLQNTLIRCLSEIITDTGCLGSQALPSTTCRLVAPQWMANSVGKVQLLEQLPQWKIGTLHWATTTETEQRFYLSKYYCCHAKWLQGQNSPAKESKMKAINLSLLSLSARIKWSVQELYLMKPQINGNLLCEKFMRQKQDLWYMIKSG